MKPVDPRIQQILDQIEVYQAIALNDYDVPQWQALPVSSAPDIAFRPNCSQLEPVWQEGNTTAWVWEGKTIYTAPEHLSPTSETLLNLQGSGICLTGSHAVDVPLVPTDEVYQEFQQQLSGAVAVLPGTTTNAQQVGQVVQAEAHQGIDFGLLFLVALPIIGLGLLARFATGKQSVKRAKKRSSTQPEAPKQTANGSVPLEEEYDFQL